MDVWVGAALSAFWYFYLHLFNLLYSATSIFLPLLPLKCAGSTAASSAEL